MHLNILSTALLPLLLLGLIACDAVGQTRPLAAVQSDALKAVDQNQREQLNKTYPWLAAMESADAVTTLKDRFPTPTNYTRINVERNSHASFLRGLPVWLGRTQVYSYSGSRIHAPSAAVVALDVGSKNLQQCADSAIRLHAEWLWAQGKRDQVGYHFTSGDLSKWKDWRRGERFKIKGSKVERRQGAARSNSHDEFRSYLEHTFRYAGTRSLRRDSDQVPFKDVKAGDFFVAPGSPGHAVVILDVAENMAGERIALIGQGFMPAQEFHVLRLAGRTTVDGVWFKVPTDGSGVKTPSWAEFSADQLRRFR